MFCISLEGGQLFNAHFHYIFPCDVLYRAVELANTMKARVAFNITHENTTKKWILHLKPGEAPAVFQQAEGASSPAAGLTDRPNVTLICSDATLLSLSTGALSPEYAYMRGLLQIKGQMGVAMKVKALLLELK